MPDAREHNRGVIQEEMNKFSKSWETRLGSLGVDLARDLNLLVDVLLTEYEDITREIVEDWAQTDNAALIPIAKIDLADFRAMTHDPDILSDGEIIELFKERFIDPRENQI